MRKDFVEIAELLDDLSIYMEESVCNELKHCAEVSQGFSEIADAPYIGYSSSNIRFLIYNRTDGKFEIIVCNRGTIPENPVIVNTYFNRIFERSEIFPFVRDFGIEMHRSLIFKPINDLIDKHREYTLFGINFETYFSMDENYNWEEEKHQLIDYILYIKDRKDGKFYRVILNTSYGMCGSGWTTATWGEVLVQKIDDVPKDFCFTPKKDNPFSVYLKYGESSNDVDILLISKGKQENFFGVDYTGGDSYYPSGGIYDYLGFLSSMDEEIGSKRWENFFDKNVSLFEEMINKKQLVPLVEEEIKDD